MGVVTKPPRGHLNPPAPSKSLTLLLDRFIPQVLSTNAPHMYDFILTKWKLVTVYRFFNSVMVETLSIFVLQILWKKMIGRRNSFCNINGKMGTKR